MKDKPDWTEQAKRNAAKEAVKHVEDGFVVGLGSGTTAAYAIEEIAKKMKREQLRISGVPTSYQALMLAAKLGIPVTSLEEHSFLDLAVDGADQVDPQLNLIKGMGGALAREKIVASASKRVVIVADEGKRVKTLGAEDHPVPVEVLPMAVPLVTRNIEALSGKPVLREGGKKVGPVVTDNGNVILDVHFGLIRKPQDLECGLKGLVGVVETGLFVGLADVVYFGTRSKVEKVERKAR